MEYDGQRIMAVVSWILTEINDCVSDAIIIKRG